MNKKVNKIFFTWEQRSTHDTERVGAMYCFKRFDVILFCFYGTISHMGERLAYSYHKRGV